MIACGIRPTGTDNTQTLVKARYENVNRRLKQGPYNQIKDGHPQATQLCGLHRQGLSINGLNTAPKLTAAPTLSPTATFREEEPSPAQFAVEWS